MGQKDAKNAEATYRKILEANANDLEVRAELGDLLVASGDQKRGEGEYADIKRRAPKNPFRLCKVKCPVCGTAKKRIEVCAELEQVLKMYPNMWSMANDAAFILADYGKGKNDLDKALTLAQKAQSLTPENPLVLDTLGWVYYKRGELKQAAGLVGKSASQKPRKNPIFNYHLGMVYYQAGDKGKAKEFLQFAAAAKENFAGKDKAQKNTGRDKSKTHPSIQVSEDSKR